MATTPHQNTPATADALAGALVAMRRVLDAGTASDATDRVLESAVLCVELELGPRRLRAL